MVQQIEMISTLMTYFNIQIPLFFFIFPDQNRESLRNLGREKRKRDADMNTFGDDDGILR